MKRLALVLAAAVLGSGCGADCPTGTAMISWTGFDGPLGTNLGCGAAGVYAVDLWLDNQYVGSSPCTDYGAAVPGVPAGPNTITVEGTDGSTPPTILFRDEIQFAVAGCDTVGLPAFPGAGTVDLQYAFQAGSGASCTSGSSYMWFTIFDDVANAVDPATIDASSPLAVQRSFPCGPTDPVVTLPAGQYELQAMNEMIEGPATVFTSAADACVLPITFPVTSQQQSVVSPTLADTNVACF